MHWPTAWLWVAVIVAMALLVLVGIVMSESSPQSPEVNNRRPTSLTGVSEPTDHGARDHGDVLPPSRVRGEVSGRGRCHFVCLVELPL